jgi:hypothetical protein
MLRSVLAIAVSATEFLFDLPIAKHEGRILGLCLAGDGLGDLFMETRDVF